MKRTILFTIAFLFTLSITFSQDSKIIFPRPFAFAIDDMGWNIGNNSGDMDQQGPYRIGIDRRMDINDYKCIVQVAKSVGVRIQGLFVLAEMDRTNILAKFPSTTWQGKDWDNSENIDQEQIDIMNYIKNNAAYLEFGLHGVGHEYWVGGKKKRAEWYCIDDNHPWPEKNMKEHIQCFTNIMAQYGLSPENGHSFPESFVPCAYGYYWNPDGDYSTGKVMSEAGVKYVNTLFDYIRELNPPSEPNGGGFDNGVIVINRINYGNEWYALSTLPVTDLAEQKTDIIESHWSNWLAQDDFLQNELNQKWIDYYKMVQSSPDRYIAKNTEQLYSQWLYKKYTKISEEKGGIVVIDNSNMPKEAYFNNILGNLVLKIILKNGEHISDAKLNNSPVASYFEEEGFGFIYLPRLEQEKYTLEYSLGKELLPLMVYNDGTYNVYSVENVKGAMIINLRTYGEQDLKIYCPGPTKIISDNEDLKIIGYVYNKKDGTLTITVSAVDIQGETGNITVKY